jgi:hypothetical protein
LETEEYRVKSLRIEFDIADAELDDVRLEVASDRIVAPR